MTIHRALVCLILFFAAPSFGRTQPADKAGQGRAKLPLDVRIEQFDVADAILREGFSELSLKSVEGLHLGFEEIIRDKIQTDPRTLSAHFSLHLKNKTVRGILDALCKSDARYTWSEEEHSVNVYPRTTKDDSSYLLNLRINRIVVNDIPDPGHALPALAKLFPEQQVGYFAPGLGDDTYAEPWTAAFEHLTVRAFIDRIAEHMGPQTAWVWEGGQQERAFTFVKGGFNTPKPTHNQN